MRYLILSDIHANLEALEAVVEEARGSYDEVVCLGDLVGYGADPNAVTDWVRSNAAHVIRGNHDKACCGLEEPTLFNPMARFAVEWTYDKLTDDNRRWLRDLPQGPLDVGPFLMVHGSVLDEDEYILDSRDAAQQFPHMFERLVFFGHTHVQGGFFLRSVNGQPAEGEASPEGLEFRKGDSLMVNPGSVGQPRDYLWTAGYAVYDTEARSVVYHRCPYPLQEAQDKIVRAGLPQSLADRLAVGR
ncbi:MAG: metallophosphoesterase [Acidobacteria bacterium]|nr:metallophosphoesterase [Acidobacteriota bacterium]